MDYVAFAKFPFSLTATSISVLKGRREGTKHPIQTPANQAMFTRRTRLSSPTNQQNVRVMRAASHTGLGWLC